MSLSLSANASVPSSLLFPHTSAITYLTSTTTWYYLTSQFTPSAECANRPFTTISPDYLGTETALRDYGLFGAAGCSHPEYITALMSSGSSSRFVSTQVTLVGVCPLGYTTVGTREKSDTYYPSTGRAVTLANTFAYCCPSNFVAAPWDDFGRPFSCQSTITTPTTLVQVSTRYTSSSLAIYSGTVSVSSKVVFDRGYVVKWNQQQLQYFSPESAPIKSLAAVTSFPSTMSTAKRPTGGPGLNGPLSGGDDDDSGGGFNAPKLSRKTIGAIVGGVLGGLAVLFSIIIGLIRKRKLKKQGAIQGTTVVEGEKADTAHVAGVMPAPGTQPAYMPPPPNGAAGVATQSMYMPPPATGPGAANTPQSMYYAPPTGDQTGVQPYAYQPPAGGQMSGQPPMYMYPQPGMVGPNGQPMYLVPASMVQQGQPGPSQSQPMYMGQPTYMYQPPGTSPSQAGTEHVRSVSPVSATSGAQPAAGPPPPLPQNVAGELPGESRQAN